MKIIKPGLPLSPPLPPWVGLKVLCNCHCEFELEEGDDQKDAPPASGVAKLVHHQNNRHLERSGYVEAVCPCCLDVCRRYAFPDNHR